MAADKLTKVTVFDEWLVGDDISLLDNSLDIIIILKVKGCDKNYLKCDKLVIKIIWNTMTLFRHALSHSSSTSEVLFCFNKNV